LQSAKYAVSSESTEPQLAVALAVVWFSVQEFFVQLLFLFLLLTALFFSVTIAVTVNLYYSVTIRVTVNCHLFFSYFAISVTVTVN